MAETTSNKIHGRLVRHHQYQGRQKLRCPYCGEMFTWREMWEDLVRTFRSATKIHELGFGWTLIQRAVQAFHLYIYMEGTREVTSWNSVAKYNRYEDAGAMFFDMRVKKGFSYKHMAKLLDIEDDKEVKRACRAFLDPHNRKSGLKRHRGEAYEGDYEKTKDRKGDDKTVTQALGDQKKKKTVSKTAEEKGRREMRRKRREKQTQNEED